MKTIDIYQDSNGATYVSVNGGPNRSLYNMANIMVKPMNNGAVLKLTDESWRQYFDLSDTITSNAVAQGPFTTVPQLVQFLTDLISLNQA